MVFLYCSTKRVFDAIGSVAAIRIHTFYSRKGGGFYSDMALWRL